MELLPLIEQIVCIGEGVLPEQLHIKTRSREIVFARHTIMYFMMKYTSKTLDIIGSTYGHNQGHCAAIYARKIINNLMETDKRINAKMTIYDLKIKSYANFEKNVVMDKIQEIKDSIISIIQSESLINPNIITLYNALIEKRELCDVIYNDSK